MLAMQSWIARLPTLTEIGLVVLGVWLLASWLMPSDIKVDETNHANVVQQIAHVDAKLIQNTPLFGSVEKVAVAEKKSAKPVAPSKLSIKLKGTVVADEKSAAVVVMKSEKEQRVFVVGDTMQPGVVLHSVEEDAIVVDNQGELERVELEKKSLGQSSPPVERYQSPATPLERPNNLQHVNRSELGRPDIRNVPGLLNQARVVPHFSKGKPDGFMINQIVSGSLYEKVGLQNGDIIRKVNGTVIANPQQAMQMFQSLQSNSAIEVEVERSGSVQQLRYDQ